MGYLKLDLNFVSEVHAAYECGKAAQEVQLHVGTFDNPVGIVQRARRCVCIPLGMCIHNVRA